MRLVFRVEGGVFAPDTKLELESGKYAIVLVGLNATGKSLLLKTMYATLGGLDRMRVPITRLCSNGLHAIFELEDDDVRMKRQIICQDREPTVEAQGEEPKSWFIPDHRLVLRALLAEYSNELEALQEAFQGYKEFYERVAEEEIKATQIYMEEFLNAAQRLYKLLWWESLPGIVLEAKKRIHGRLFAELLETYNEALEEAAAELNKRFSKLGFEIHVSDLEPLEVDVSEDNILVRDKRFDIETVVDPRLVSSSISSFLTIQALLYIAARLERDITFVFIEEPEEALAPPQQYAAFRALGRVLEKAWKRNRPTILVMTTHSPYVAYAAAEYSEIYYVYYKRGEGFTVTKEYPFTVFALADTLMMLRRLGGD